MYDYRRVDYAEFLTRLEPRPARLQPGEATEHGARMKLLELERERLAEQAAGIRRDEEDQTVCQNPHSDAPEGVTDI